MRNTGSNNVDLKSVGTTRSCLAWTFRLCSCCGILVGTMTLLMNLLQVSEIEYGNPEGFTNFTGSAKYAELEKHANLFMDSHFYQDNKNVTLLPNYEAIAVNMPTKMPDPSGMSPAAFEAAMHNLTLPIGRVIYTETDARFFVMLYFLVSILNLCGACVCCRASDVNFNMEADAEARLAVQRGAVNQNDAPRVDYGDEKAGAVGYYSNRVRRARGVLLVLFGLASLIDVTKLYFQAKAVETDLAKCYGAEYRVWYDLTIEGMSMQDIMMANRTGSGFGRMLRMLDEDDDDESTSAQRARCAA